MIQLQSVSESLIRTIKCGDNSILSIDSSYKSLWISKCPCYYFTFLYSSLEKLNLPPSLTLTPLHLYQQTLENKQSFTVTHLSYLIVCVNTICGSSPKIYDREAQISHFHLSIALFSQGELLKLSNDTKLVLLLLSFH